MYRNIEHHLHWFFANGFCLKNTSLSCNFVLSFTYTSSVKSKRAISQYWAPSALIFWQRDLFQNYITLSCNFVLFFLYTSSVRFKRVVLFSPLSTNIKNSDDIIISGYFKRYFKPKPCPILSKFLMLLSLYESQAIAMLYCWGRLFNIIQTKSPTVLLFRGNTRIRAITSRKYVCSFLFQVTICCQLNINLLELYHRVYFLHISLVFHLVHKQTVNYPLQHGFPRISKFDNRT